MEKTIFIEVVLGKKIQYIIRGKYNLYFKFNQDISDKIS